MGFTKRYCYKDSIIRAKSYDDVISMTKADAVFFDVWTSEFFKNFDFNIKEYEENRNLINEKTKFDSGSHFNIYKEYESLKKLGNIYINLKEKNVSHWLEISLTLELLDIEVPLEIQGRHDPLVKFCITEINNYFSKNEMPIA